MEKQQNLKSTISFRVKPEERERLKIISINENRRLSELLREMVRDRVIINKPEILA